MYNFVHFEILIFVHFKFIIYTSDYIVNKLGGFTQEHPEQKKPDCPLVGQDGNVFNLMGIASRTLRRNGLAEQAKEIGRAHV